MAFVHLILSDTDNEPTNADGGLRLNSFDRKAMLLIGNPANVAKITSIPSDWTAAGAPQMEVPDVGRRMLVVITDTEIELAIVRNDHDPDTVAFPTPIKPPTNGIVAYTVVLPGYANDIFVRTP